MAKKTPKYSHQQDLFPSGQHEDDVLDAEGDAPDTYSKGKYSGQIAWNGGTLTRDVATSMFYKTLRIGDADGACYWYAVLRDRFGVDRYKLLRTLQMLCGEDLCPEDYPHALIAARGALEMHTDKTIAMHNEAHAVYIVARARKWYMTEQGRELERIRHRFKGMQHKYIDRPAQPWAYDFHTRLGWRRKGDEQDLRLFGGWEMRWPIADRWLKMAEGMPGATEEQLRAKWIEMHYTPISQEDHKIADGAKAVFFDNRKKSKTGGPEGMPATFCAPDGWCPEGEPYAID